MIAGLIFLSVGPTLRSLTAVISKIPPLPNYGLSSLKAHRVSSVWFIFFPDRDLPSTPGSNRGYEKQGFTQVISSPSTRHKFVRRAGRIHSASHCDS